MADVVGVVAAGVAFAEVLVKLSTLKRLWDHLNDVPDVIKSLVEKIELLGMLIQEMEADLTSTNLAFVTTGGSIHTFLVASCRRSLDALSLSISELSQEINSRKRIKRAVIKGKIILKKDFWAAYEQRLQQLALHLELTQQHLTLWLLKRQPDLIVSRLEQSMKEAEQGRSKGARAMLGANAQAIATMVDWGLDLVQCFDPTSPVKGSFWLLFFSPHQETIKEVHSIALANNLYEEIADLWPLSHNEIIGLQQAQNVRFLGFTENAYSLALFLPYLQPGHYDLPIERRLMSISYIPFPIFEPDSLRHLLWADGRVRPDDIQALDQLEISLLRFIASRYSYDRYRLHDHSATLQSWRPFAMEVIQLTTLLHSIYRPENESILGWGLSGGTALYTVIGGDHYVGCFEAYCDSGTFGEIVESWRRKTERALRHWLEDLKSCGIDLNEYGRTETNIFLDHEWVRSQVYIYKPQVGRPNGSGVRFDMVPSAPFFRLNGFSYGPEPQDWKFDWEMEYGEMVAEFWDLIEDPPVKMIGAWVDDD